MFEHSRSRRSCTVQEFPWAKPEKKVKCVAVVPCSGKAMQCNVLYTAKTFCIINCTRYSVSASTQNEVLVLVLGQQKSGIRTSLVFIHSFLSAASAPMLDRVCVGIMYCMSL